MSREIQLTQGQVAIVCDCHAHLVEGHKWYAHWDPGTQSFRAARKTSRLFGAQREIYMHAEINSTPNGFHTDHIDGDTLNNRCSNLRTATPGENQRNRGKQINNTSGYKGVAFHKQHRKWSAQIRLNGKYKHIGLFGTAEEAARAYDEAAREIHGDFANTNF